MTFIRLFSFLPLVLTACSSPQRDKTDASQQPNDKNYTSRSIEHFPSDEKNLTARGNYFALTPFSDSTVKIAWGNDTLSRVHEDPLDLMFAERLRVQWENKDYLVLRYGTGTGAWQTVVFPLNQNEQVQVFDNGLCFDPEFNLLGTEELGDTVLAVHNLRTHQKQFILEKQRPCDAALNSSCIDSINIENKELYYRWVTPHTSSDKRKSSEKRVRLTI